MKNHVWADVPAVVIYAATQTRSPRMYPVFLSGTRWYNSWEILCFRPSFPQGALVGLVTSPCRPLEKYFLFRVWRVHPDRPSVPLLAWPCDRMLLPDGRIAVGRRQQSQRLLRGDTPSTIVQGAPEEHRFPCLAGMPVYEPRVGEDVSPESESD